ncbi:hypothetical protein [Ligilactobacillus ceti]|uniref:hypothetical protein n=1 Tax=Ligilactobacillus ceti TaxID=395085 RepID=UPI000420D1CC|nr:hypothetical protein [Ligilactobacillus ceti]
MNKEITSNQNEMPENHGPVHVNCNYTLLKSGRKKQDDGSKVSLKNRLTQLFSKN